VYGSVDAGDQAGGFQSAKGLPFQPDDAASLQSATVGQDNRVAVDLLDDKSLTLALAICTITVSPAWSLPDGGEPGTDSKGIVFMLVQPMVPVVSRHVTRIQPTRCRGSV
jgi:hypothetical protein